ncbi:CPBP family intramembrane metalloprotease [Clostridium sp. cel8]|uniref:CPBP family intramembrane glutamic endopeptidase n=1 Tax=unclassified Clostridium TaxID=2614128 RepID=UPI0015F52A33|nr:CPBP family intramembrane glutamic endopeptidase [Clostridium sp. cel8]MBA5851251.1 CPBP family intramembrane metalloprotease [Clostridium sp. cel8]
MIKLNLIKDILTFLIVYMPPILLYGMYWIRKNRNRVVLAIISVLYVVASIYTQNLIPFIFVLLNIVHIRNTEDFYIFDIKRFRFLKGLKLIAISYLGIIIISIIETIVASNFNFTLNQQEIVTRMSDMSLKSFMLMIPVVSIFAPVFEEFVFRWLFFKKIFANRVGIYSGAVLSSLIFAFMHFSLTAFFIIFWIGIYNCYLIHNKGYWYSVFNHCVFNSVSMMSLFLQNFIIK